jgi:hypothetical protein
MQVSLMCTEDAVSEPQRTPSLKEAGGNKNSSESNEIAEVDEQSEIGKNAEESENGESEDDEAMESFRPPSIHANAGHTRYSKSIRFVEGSFSAGVCMMCTECAQYA